MPSTINADNGVVSGSSGVKTTADTSGVLALQSNGSTALSISTGLVTTLTNPLPVGSGGTGATSLSGITVGTATNATNATTATNLAGGSNGTIPYQSASGTTQMLAVGTSGQLLQTNGAGAPTWVTPTPPASGLTLITTLTASNSASLSFTNTSITSSYDLFLFVFNNIKFVNHNRELTMRVSTDNGSTFISAAGSYGWCWLQNANASGGGTSFSNSSTYITVGDPVNVGNAFAPPGSSFNGALYMANPLDSSQGTQFWGILSANEAASYNASSYFGGGYRKNAEANNAIQFLELSGGNIASGTIQIFGVQK
jgi:hypothetical protein